MYCDLSLSLVGIKFTFFFFKYLESTLVDFVACNQREMYYIVRIYSKLVVSSLLSHNFNNLSTFKNIFYYFVFKRQTNNEHITNNECENRRPQMKNAGLVLHHFGLSF